METFDEAGAAVAMEMGLPLDIVSEEVVTQDEGEADSDGLTAAMDCLTSQPSVNILSKFGRELGYLDSSEDEDPCLHAGQSAAEGGGSDVWVGNVRDDCLCWECGERFRDLDRLMVHFRKHEACMRCNVCHVTFRRVVSLSMHLDNVHGNVDLYCGPCHLSFRSKWDLNEHLGKHLEPGDPPGANPRKKSKVAPIPETASVSSPTTPSVLVSVPITVCAPVSVPLSAPITVSAPASGRVPVSAPVPLASVPIFLPVSVPISLPVSVPGPCTVPVASVSGAVSVPVPVSAPVSVPGPISVPVPVTISMKPPSSTVKGWGPPLDESTLNALVAMDHTYNNTCKTGNGVAASSYGLRMRHTKELAKAFPPQSLPESARQKKIHLVLFRNEDRRKEKKARAAGGERDQRVEEVAEEKDVKPDASSLIPPLPRCLAPSDQGIKIKQEPADHFSEEVEWEGEPIEEDEATEQLIEEMQSDETMSFEDGSEYDPGSASDVSTESMSSGNSSGSSYTPIKRRGKRVRNQGRPRGRKLRRAGSGHVAIAPARHPPASDSVNLCQSSGDQANLQASAPAAVRLKMPEQSAVASNVVMSRLALRPSRMYACDQCREVFPEQVTYKRHHCPMKTAAVMTWSAPVPVPGPVAAIQNPAVGSFPAPAAQTTITAPSASGPASGSSSGLMKVTQMAVPCSIQNSAMVSPLPVASGPVFTLPSIMLPSPTPSVQSGSRPLMATMLFNSNGSAGRLTRLVFQSQGLTFPTHTLSQTRPIRLSVPSQANPSTPGQASPSMQLANLMIGGLIQPQTLVKAAQPPTAPSPAPVPGLTPAHTPAPVLITAPTPTSVAGPAPVSAPSLIPATAPITIPTPISAPSRITIPNPITIPTPKTGPTPVTAPAPFTVSTFNTAPTPIKIRTPNTAPAPLKTPTPITASFLLPALAPLPASSPPPAPGPLRILGMFANRSQELALQKRLAKSWRSKGVFLCRQCGAVSRQPSLGVRHRYLHRGSRRHRCHCGRTFLHRLHLLRHHVQHAEATRFVCAPCGRTFSGARCLARHKRDQERKRKKKRARYRKDCHAPFSCDCGQIFQRPAAFLWHKLKNPGV